MVQVALLRFKLHSLVAWLSVDIYGQKSGKIIEKSLYSVSGLVYRPPIESKTTKNKSRAQSTF